MVVVGLLAVGQYSGMKMPRFALPTSLQKGIALGQKAAMGFRPVNRALVIGLLTGFLPCGWLYAFAIVAAGTGSVVMGAAVMVAFWAGTVPILASLGIGVQALTGTLGRRLPLATALVIVGPNWLGPWQEQEYYALLDRAVSESEGKGRRLRLIPVLLPGVPRKPELPVFLRGRQWVDFRGKEGLEDREAIRQLVAAILEK